MLVENRFCLALQTEQGIRMINATAVLTVDHMLARFCNCAIFHPGFISFHIRQGSGRSALCESEEAMRKLRLKINITSS